MHLFCRPFFTLIILAAGMALGLSSCNTTRHVPEGKQLLERNEVRVNGRRVRSEEIVSIIKQRPNREVRIRSLRLGKPYLAIYSWSKPGRSNFFDRLYRRVGEEPVLVDSLQVHRTAKQIGLYLFGKGYFNNQYSYEIVPDKKNPKKAKIEFNYYTGNRYYFRNLDYTIANPDLESLVKSTREKSLIKRGLWYDADTLEAERGRLTTLFRNNGYYGFPRTVIRYQVDTLVGDFNVDVNMIISDIPVVKEDTTYTIPHKKYNIGDVHVVVSNTPYADTVLTTDTVIKRGYVFLNASELDFTTDFISRHIQFESHQLYRQRNITRTYSSLNSVRNFRAIDISFQPQKDSAGNDILLTRLKLTPQKKRGITFETDFTNTSGVFGINGGIGYQNRNIFKGGEILELKLRGALESQVISSDDGNFFNTYEFGVETSLRFQRFLAPRSFNQRLPRRMDPKSRVFIGVTQQNRLEFNRLLWKTGLEYQWNESNTKTHIVTPIDISYVNIFQIDPRFQSSLNFTTGFTDNFISASRYTFVFNDQVRERRQSNYFRGTVELAGNVLDLSSDLIALEMDTELDPPQKVLLDVPYAQFVKLDADYRQQIRLTPEHRLVYRFFSGISYGYGNTPFAPPFEKQFFAGGSNDIRAWQAYRLGPGSVPLIDGRQPISTGTLKFLGSIEYRFPVLGPLKGAFFMDAGNVWYLAKDLGFLETVATQTDAPARNEIGFFAETFWRQIAIGPGFGLRYDFGFFVFRLDTGYKLYNPAFATSGVRGPWPTSFSIRDFVLSPALGYPF